MSTSYRFVAFPDVNYFRTFGCVVYLVLPETQRPSFVIRTVNGIFLGSFHSKSFASRTHYEGTISSYETGRGN